MTGDGRGGLQLSQSVQLVTSVGLESAAMVGREGGGGASNDNYGPGVGLTQLPSAIRW